MSSNRKRKRSTSPQGLQEPTTVPRLKAYFLRYSVDAAAPCTATQGLANASAGRTAQTRCWIAEKLALWNSILHHVGLELREYSTGKVTLQNFVVCDPSATEFRVVSAFLVKRLLSAHHCVERLDLRYFGELFGDKSQLGSQVVLSAGVQQIEIDGRQVSKMELGKLVHVMLRGNPLQLALHSVFLGTTEMTALVRNINTGTRLSDLDLSDCGLKGRDCIRLFEAIETCLTLNILKLDSNYIGVRGAQHFAKLLLTNTTLTTVSLYRTKLKDKGAAAIGDALEANKTLKVLQLGENSIGSLGAKAITSSLRINTSLVRLDLQGNNLENSGALLFAQSLRCNQALRKLYLCRNGIIDDGVVAIANSLANQETLQCLSINDNHFGKDGVEAIARLIAANNRLTDLNIDSTRNLMLAVELNHLAEALAHNRTLKCIGLRVHCPIAMAALSRTLRSHETLRELSIDTAVTDLSPLLSGLAENRSIQHFELHGIMSMRNVEGFANLLSKTMTLRAVDISNKVCNTALIRLVYALQYNASIWIFCVGSQTLALNACEAIAAMLATNTTLHTLSLDHASAAGEAGLQILANSLAGNRYLQQLLVAYPESSAARFAVRECLRRNGDGFSRAIQFVLGKATDRDSAATFQLHQRSDLFIRELSFFPGVSSPLAATHLVKEARNYIREHYFVITGVVKKAIECPKPRRTRGKRAVQFDELNAYCLSRIASFLKVVDVKCS